MSSASAPLHVFALDAAGAALHLCLARFSDQESPQFYSAERLGPKSHDESLAALFDEILRQAAIAPPSISAVVVGEGPGSFTGLRIGYAFAKGLSYSLRCPLIPVSSHAGAAYAYALAREGHSIPKSMVVASSAGKEQLIVSRVALTPDPLANAMPRPALLSVDEFLARYGKAASIETRGQAEETLLSLDDGGPTMCPQLAWTPASLVARGLLEAAVPFHPQRLGRTLRESAEWGAFIASLPFSLKRVAEVAPNYVRAAAAKTIEERAGAKIAN